VDLTDLGLIGFGLFVAMIVAIAAEFETSCAPGARRRPVSAGEGDEPLPRARAHLIERQPGFGGQIDTVVTALFVGTLAAINRMISLSPRASLD
jgi:hypothetical protein